MDEVPRRPGPPPAIWLGGGIEAVLHLAGAVTQGRLSVVEHPMLWGR